MKRFFKSTFSIFLAITFILSSAYVGINEVDFGSVFAVDAKAVESGTCGDNLTWTLDDEGTLTISGTGPMYSYFVGDEEYAPWYSDKITEIIINEGVTSIGDEAFYNCTSLTSITIPDSVTSIGDWAFNYCTSLASVTIGDSVTSIGFRAFYNCTSLASATIGGGVTSIGDEAFYNCTSLTSITIPDSVTSIGDWAFNYCTSLTSITIPDSVTSIGDYAFSDCTSLTSITIPDSVTSIGKDAFSDCTSLTSITIPDSVTSIGSDAFYNTGYYNDTDNWENDVLYIGNYLLKAKDTISGDYVIKEGTKTIADYAFYNCDSLTSITIPDSVTSIGDYAFYYCESLTSITIPNSVTSIGEGAFRDCTSLKSVTIGEGVTSIGDWVFDDCTRLKSITIPDSVTSISNSAFYNTGYYNDTNNWKNDVLYIGNHLIKAKGSINGDYVIKEGTKTIADYAFCYCTSLTSITIPDSVTSIGYHAFYECTSLTSATIGGGVTSIDRYAFYNCTSLTAITIPDSVTSIGGWAFYNCDSITSITIPDSVTSIGKRAFYGCKKFKYVFYGGTKEDRDKISIGLDNERLTNALWHYEGTRHSYSGWIIDKKATVNAPGKKHKECSGCGEIINEVIPQLKCKAVTLNKVTNVATGVRVYWSKTTGADSYRVYRKTKSSGWKVIGNTTKAYYTDTTAKSGTVYYYSVRAINEAGLGATCKTTKSLKCLADPTLKVPTSSRSGITLKWTKTAGASGYVIYRKAGNGSWKKLVTEKGVSNLSYVDKTAKKDTTYTYKIRAYYGKTYSAYSNTRQIKDKY